MIYEPVTEFGKKVASLLRYDDGVRLEIHDYLEEVEPELQEIIEKAEIYDRYVKHLASLEEFGVWGAINKLDAKLEAVKNAFREHYGVGLPENFHASDYDACDAYYLADDIKKIIESSELGEEQ